jgi:3,5-epimerase/4-reductase
MPLFDDLHPRNFISKITKYERVVNIPNSMTVLHDLLPISVNMFERRLVGIYNFTNPGAISHNEILDLYAKRIDPTFTYKNFSLEDQSRILQAGRSNNELDCGKLLQAVPDCRIPHIKDSVVQLFHQMKTNLSVTQPPRCYASSTVHHCNHLDGGSVTSSRAV